MRRSEVQLARRINSLSGDFLLWPALTNTQPSQWTLNLGYPLLLSVPDTELDAHCQQLIDLEQKEMSWSTCFDTEFIIRLWYRGFFTITLKLSRDFFVLGPKLHVERCLLFKRDFTLKKKSIKKGRGMKLCFDKNFELVYQKIVEQHGHNWVCPQLMVSFREMFNANGRREVMNNVSLHSVELWDGDLLVAGELGVILGNCYTSLTGFSDTNSLRKGVGTIQLNSLICFLFMNGIELIDFGMSMDYKLKLGAKQVPRTSFLREWRARRDNESPWSTESRYAEENEVSAVMMEFYSASKINAKVPEKDKQLAEERRLLHRKERLEKKDLVSEFYASLEFEVEGEQFDLDASRCFQDSIHLNWQKLLAASKIIVKDNFLKIVKLPAINVYCFPVFQIAKSNNMEGEEIFEILKELLSQKPKNCLIHASVAHINSKIYFSIKPGALLEWTTLQEKDNMLLLKKTLASMKIPLISENYILDYSGPNLAKELHIGHLRSTLLGDFLRNFIAVFLDSSCSLRCFNHLGDYGSQFGMILAFIFAKYTEDSDVQRLIELGPLRVENGNLTIANKTWTNDEILRTENIVAVSTIYVKSKEYAKSNIAFKLESSIWHQRLQQGHNGALTLWQFIKDISMAHLQKHYDFLGIANIEAKGESSFATEVTSQVVELLLSNNIAQRRRLKVQRSKYERATSVCVKYSNERSKQVLNKVIVKSDTTIGYALFDLAAIFYRKNLNEGPTRILYVADETQKDHFDFIFKTAKKMEWLSDTVSADFVSFGLLLDENGTKMKSRNGKAVSLRKYEKLVKDCSATLVTGENDVKDLFSSALIRYIEFSHSRSLSLKVNTQKWISIYSKQLQLIKSTITETKRILESFEVNVENITLDRGLVGVLSLLSELETVLKITWQKKSAHLLVHHLRMIALKMKTPLKVIRKRGKFIGIEKTVLETVQAQTMSLFYLLGMEI